MSNVKIFQKYVKGYGQGQMFKIYGTGMPERSILS